MPRAYSLTARRQLHTTASDDPPLVLLEITHPNLSTPVRVVGDTQDLVSNGVTFVAMGFRVRLPDEINGQQPRAELAVDNVGRELMQWIEQSAGGRNAKVRLMQALRSNQVEHLTLHQGIGLRGAVRGGDGVALIFQAIAEGAQDRGFVIH